MTTPDLSLVTASAARSHAYALRQRRAMNGVDHEVSTHGANDVAADDYTSLRAGEPERYVSPLLAASREQRTSKADTSRRAWKVRLLVLALALVAAGATMILGASDAQAAVDESAEAEFVALINVERAKRGIPGLVSRSDLRDVARSHSRTMAASSDLHHNPELTSDISGWQTVAENVGRGPSVSALHRALMESPSHRANILNERLTQIGVGVEVRDGVMWVTQNFRRPLGEVSSLPTATTQFGDVRSTNVHLRGILAGVDQGFVEACGIARFCPNDSVTRADFVVMLAKAMGIEPADSTRFSDVSGSAGRYAEALTRRGVVNGTSATTFSPDRDLTRAQFSALLARALELDPVPSPFSDTNTVHADSIGALAERGVVRGCTPERFCPSDSITRAQAATILNNEFGR